METNVQTYDPSKLMEMVRDRIRATYVSLIPDTQWTAMVQQVVDDFFKEGNQQYYDRKSHSPFKGLVYEELEKKSREIVQNFLASISSTEWTSYGMKPNEYIETFIKENAGTIFSNVIGGMIQNTLSMMQNH